MNVWQTERELDKSVDPDVLACKLCDYVDLGTDRQVARNEQPDVGEQRHRQGYSKQQP